MPKLQTCTHFLKGHLSVSLQWRMWGRGPLILGENDEMTEGRIAGRANKTKPGPPLSSRSGSATASMWSILLRLT